MNALIGRLLIYLALAAATSGAVVALTGGARPSAQRTKLARMLGAAFAWSAIGATLVMVMALLQHDFSVSYVAQVGSRSTPTVITIVSLWSSLEGSILFWAAVLGIYTLFWLRMSRDRTDDPRTTSTVGVVLLVATFFTLLIAAVANPFLDTAGPIPLDGPGPNPLLQNHPLMIIHPPMLYLGYVGMTVPFAMAFAALLAGRVGPDWTRSLRHWILAPWAFLTAGVLLGGRWAYDVLGWGGYWGWDPVENASFLPWLTATAFIHASMLEERKGLYRGWAMVLVLTTFALTVLGTFMTRSGVFNSVHSFTQSPIGPLFLAFLATVVLASIVLLAMRIHTLAPGQPMRSALSREAAFVFNNLLFVIFTFAVLIGTTYPLLAEAFRGIKVSVGGPFFDDFAVPIGIAITFLMGIGPALPWGRASARDAALALALPLGAGVLTVLVFVAAGMDHAMTLVALGAAGFAVAVSLRDMIEPIIARRRAHGGGLVDAARSTLRRTRRRNGGQIVHIGVALVVSAIAISSSYQVKAEGVARPGGSLAVGDYSLVLNGMRVVNEPHRQRQFADFVVYRAGEKVGVLSPAMNQYAMSMNPIGTPAVMSTAGHDLYLSLMHLDSREAGLRAFINPGVSWLWIGGLVMLLGTAIAAWPSRKRATAPVVAEGEATAGGAA